jgi:hypothetical protein
MEGGTIGSGKVGKRSEGLVEDRARCGLCAGVCVVKRRGESDHGVSL